MMNPSFELYRRCVLRGIVRRHPLVAHHAEIGGVLDVPLRELRQQHACQRETDYRDQHRYFSVQNAAKS
jgi:hypothetical protein